MRKARNPHTHAEAIELANRTPCALQTQTPTRATRNFAGMYPAFAVEAGIAALRWLTEGYGYELIGADVLDAYSYAKILRRRLELSQ